MKTKSRRGPRVLLFCGLLLAAGAHGREAGFRVTVRAGPHGSVAPASVTVAAGQTASFTILPEEGYAAMVSGCGGSVSGVTYTTAPVKRDCQVKATFLRVMPANKVM
jgi:hypothetical protein